LKGLTSGHPSISLGEHGRPLLAEAISESLRRPAGWLESRAGIRGRRRWADQDPLAAAASAGRECLERAGVPAAAVGAVLVTGEAPPMLTGLAPALHHRLRLRSAAAAVEVGGACTGFLAAVRLAQGMFPGTGAVLIIAVEAPSRYLVTGPGPSGEAAALFGDGAAAALLTPRPAHGDAVALAEVMLGADGSAADLLRVERSLCGVPELHMDGPVLAGRAVRVMARAVRDLGTRHGVAVAGLRGVVAHGGNGRMPALLARQLGLPTERVWSETPTTGNLGAASLPAAWAARPPEKGPVAWVAFGAGITWAATVTGVR
jgi:3-oxoacyl-[acyl-carrier-protein] synthase-3